MKLEVVRDPNKFDYYTPEDEALFAELIKRDGALAIFLYSRNVLTKDGLVKFDPTDKSMRSIARSGVMYVPVSFFERFLGKTPSSSDTFVPLVKTCKSLGVFVRIYNDGMLAVIEGRALDGAIAENPRLIYAGGYAVLGKYDATKFTSDDFKAAKDKWREAIVGSPSINDLSDPDIKEKIDAISKRCQELHEGLHREADAYCLIGTKKPADSVDLLTQYSAVSGLAIGYATYGSRFYRDEKILNDVLYGLRWMYENMYGEAEMEERGWRSAHAYDWWHWFVGGVEPLTDALLLVEEHLTMEEKQTYLKCFKWVTTFMRVGYLQNCATSRIRVCTKTALLLEDTEWLENEFYDYDLLTEINEEGEGCHIDFVNWTHQYPFNLVYGHNNLNRVLNVGAILGGTPLEFTSPKQYNLFKMVKYMFEPVHYKGRGFIIFCGRGTHGPEWMQGAVTVANLLPMIGLFGEDEDIYVKRLIKRYSVMPEIRKAVKSLCAIKELSKYIAILNDPEIPSDSVYEIGHSYFTGDRAVVHRGDYAFCVALASNRHPSYESINGGNKIGWYSGDGALYLYTNNDNYTFDGDSFLFNEKVAYNIPGTTVDEQKRIPWSHRGGLRNPCDFAGSLSAEDRFVVAAMDYAAYNFTGKTEPETDEGHGGGFLYHVNDLVAKKSYFLFDKECVCLGAGISSTTGSPVKTVIENRNLVLKRDGKNYAEKTGVDSSVLSSECFAQTRIDKASFAYLEGVAGYVLLESAPISVEKYEVGCGRHYHEGGSLEDIVYDEPKRFFKLCIEHGENPKGATYAYAVIPYADEAASAAYAGAPEVEIISNTPECQAVRKPSLGLSFYAFHAPTSCEELTVSAPCIVSVLEKDGEYKITVCDPTQKLDEIRISVDRALYLSDENGALLSADGDLVINTHHSVGRPYTESYTVKD